MFFFFNDPPTTEINTYCHTLSLPDALPIYALDAAFPLNKPVLVADIRGAIGKAGNDGTLRPTLEAIADQTSPILVVVRVAEGVDDEATEANIIGPVGVDGVATGLQALLDRTEERSVGKEGVSTVRFGGWPDH